MLLNTNISDGWIVLLSVEIYVYIYVAWYILQNEVLKVLKPLQCANNKTDTKEVSHRTKEKMPTIDTLAGFIIIANNMTFWYFAIYVAFHILSF